MKIHPAVFEIPRAEDFLPKILKTSIKCTILHFKKNVKTFSNIVFAYIAHAKFQKASFNSNRDIKQNIRGVGGDGDGPQNNTSRRFQKRAGGNKHTLIHKKTLFLFSILIYS